MANKQDIGLTNKYDLRQEKWRFTELNNLQDEFPQFHEFAVLGMRIVYGLHVSELQTDMCVFFQYGRVNRMLQAQRSQGKTFLALFYSIWRWIHDPREIILVLSATKENSLEIAQGISEILGTWEILKCLRPGPLDRGGSYRLDIHGALRGANKSPSLNCMSIGASLQSKRATILIADDVESAVNSLTASLRMKLLAATKEFSSLVQTGDIIFLGTPQLSDSTYNTLPGRGYEVRIWPGRIPSDKQIKNYGGMLAPILQARFDADPANRTGNGLHNDRGVITDPDVVTEEMHLFKEQDQESGYDLQFMLDTSLMDAERFPCNVRDLIITTLDPVKAPDDISWTDSQEMQLGAKEAENYELYQPAFMAPTSTTYKRRIMFVDPAGGANDTFAAIIIWQFHKFFYVPAVMGLRGGATIPNIEAIANFADRYSVNQCYVETNYGGNANVNMLAHALATDGTDIGVEGIFAVGMKEQRIVDVLSPLLRQHRLILSRDALIQDYDQAAKFSNAERISRRLIHQIHRIANVTGALASDDMVDALTGGLKILVDASRDEETKSLQQIHDERILNFMFAEGLPGNEPTIQTYRSF